MIVICRPGGRSARCSQLVESADCRIGTSGAGKVRGNGLYPPNSDEPVKRLHNLIRESQVEADVGCFWYGARGARRPIISERVRNAFERLPARIELDFDTD
jgi:hypothetical protein